MLANWRGLDANIHPDRKTPHSENDLRVFIFPHVIKLCGFVSYRVYLQHGGALHDNDVKDVHGQRRSDARVPLRGTHAASCDYTELIRRWISSAGRLQRLWERIPHTHTQRERERERAMLTLQAGHCSGDRHFLISHWPVHSATDACQCISRRCSFT